MLRNDFSIVLPALERLIWVMKVELALHQLGSIFGVGTNVGSESKAPQAWPSTDTL